MDGSSRKIEIFAPFGAALELTKLILFRPFDLGKWCVIGFAAFLAHLAGGGFNFSYKRGFPGNWNWNYRSFSDVTDTTSAMPGWLLPVLIVGGVFVTILAVVLLWIGSRGRFVFTDCVVRNRGAIVEPWNEFGKEGNSLFFFSLLVGLAMMAVIAIAGIPVWVPLIFHPDDVGGAGFAIGLIVLAVVAVCLLLPMAIISMFMVPIMYRRRCGALEAFRTAVALVFAEPGPVILYVLFVIVLWIAFSLVACVATCVTCCITAIPYVGTVILLPAYVFFMSFLLLFLRQFGPEYDVWAGVTAVQAPTESTVPPPPSPPEPPPLQV